MPDSLQKTFTDHSLRCTRQRRAVYEALSTCKCHPTADELFRMVKDQAEGMSLATVYNTLDVLCGAGLAYKIAGCGDNGSTRYDAGGDDHLHLRCKQTGQVMDAPHDLGKRILEHIPQHLLDELQQHTGFKVDKVQLDLVGEFKKN
jgi:Fe2+ or Zn2+ uptake regulation protein